MRAFLAAAVTLAFLATPAHSQEMGKRHRQTAQKTEKKKTKFDEKAYNDALARIPDSKQEYDPWRISR
jgi:hypothetical protein